MNVIQNFIPDGAACDTKTTFKKKPNLITLHWIGPYPWQTPEDVRNYWIESNGEASAHVIIKNNTVLQCWPLDKVAWHAGCEPGNFSSIGIELIPKNRKGEFSEETLATLKEYIQNTPELKSCFLVRHYDWTGKKCPSYYCEHSKWIDLIKYLDRYTVQ